MANMMEKIGDKLHMGHGHKDTEPQPHPQSHPAPPNYGIHAAFGTQPTHDVAPTGLYGVHAAPDLPASAVTTYEGGEQGQGRKGRPWRGRLQLQQRERWQGSAASEESGYQHADGSSGRTLRWPKPKPAADTSIKSPRGTNLKKPVDISPALQQFLDTQQASWADTMKLIWDYIKRHNLQIEADRRRIVCDAKFKKFLGKDEVNFLEMSTSGHFLKNT
ncbi:hypothetical protein L7F22_053257 [Adiantum nelumboides]|nr:hypothetical protein [Adiantum nelumboides]